MPTEQLAITLINHFHAKKPASVWQTFKFVDASSTYSHQTAKDSLKGAANWEVMWSMPHPLVVKYRDKLTRAARIYVDVYA